MEWNNNWRMPEIDREIKHGDMPGDKVCIEESHIAKTKVVFPELLKQLPEIFKKNGRQRAVITVCGGSGVGKSEIASLISYCLEQAGISSYTLSGDNYPRRMPTFNDAERLHIFRESGLKEMIKEAVYTRERFEIIQKFQREETDADKRYINEFPWYEVYLNGGIRGLKTYLGTEKEIAFAELTEITSRFKNGEKKIWLKRMGRDNAELWYEEVAFEDAHILVIEWTHGNSDCYQGVDIPILLNSTPKETLAHRQARNRDGGTDSPFTMRVLEIEQEMLEKQAHKAKIIVSKQGELLDYEKYQLLMKAAKEAEGE